jgi:hypothetical protein
MDPAGQKSAARVQAATVRVRERFVEERFGLPGLQRYRAAASSELRELFALKKDPPGGWVPFPLFIEATTLVDRLFGTGDLGLVWETGRFAATHSIGVWKSLFMRHVTPNIVVGITGGLWSHHYDAGRLVSRAIGHQSLEFAILDFPTPHRAHCLAIAGWMQGSLELGPRKNILVREMACRTEGAHRCEFQVSWT